MSPKRRGAEYDDGARRKSDLYLDFAPVVISRRVELPDLPRLIQQLTGLERRVGSFGGGKDRIDHASDGHDDLANAVAGLVVMLNQDRRPALIDLRSLTGDGLSAEGAGEVVSFGSLYPGRLDNVFLTIAAAEADLAWVVCGYGVDYGDTFAAREKLYVLDVGVAYYRPGFFDQLINERIAEVVKELGPRDFSIIAPEHLAAQLVRYAGVLSPSSAFDPEEWITAAADCIARGVVRFCPRVIAQMKTQAIGAALTLRAADPVETALRKAFIWAIWAHFTPDDAALRKIA
jgi:hypothetical protein